MASLARSIRLLFIVAWIVLLPLGSLAAQDSDDSELGWLQSFEKLCSTLEQDYAFTAWKGIEWNTLCGSWVPQVRAAQMTTDTAAFYLAVRGMVHSIPDRHVKIRGEPSNLRAGMTGGGFGFAVGQADDGDVYVTRVRPGSVAAQSAVEPGDRVLRRAGIALPEALSGIDLTWSRGLPGTRVARALEALRWMVRAPSGSEVLWAFQDSGGTTREVILPSEFDQGWSHRFQDFYTTDEERETPIQWRVLSGAIGYLRVTTLAHPDPAVARMIDDDFGAGIEHFNQSGVRSIILDLRHNSGGLDELAVDLVGHFFHSEEHYLQVATPIPGSDRFTLSEDPDDLLLIRPVSPFYDGTIVVLVSPGTVSAGEGMAEAVSRLPNGFVAGGRMGSNGSYGITGGRFDLPMGLRVVFPEAASLDAAGRVLLDSDASGAGGVQPDIVIPSTRETLLDQARGKDPELDYVIAWLERGR